MFGFEDAIVDEYKGTITALKNSFDQQFGKYLVDEQGASLRSQAAAACDGASSDRNKDIQSGEAVLIYVIVCLKQNAICTLFMQKLDKWSTRSGCR